MAKAQKLQVLGGHPFEADGVKRSGFVLRLFGLEEVLFGRNDLPRGLHLQNYVGLESNTTDSVCSSIGVSMKTTPWRSRSPGCS